MQRSDDFLVRYMEELSYLRRMGSGYARAYPKIAGRLELGGDESPDPHVERLIEAFAFLSARIQTDLEADFPEIAAELLNALYPHYLQPIPSMSIAQFTADRKEFTDKLSIRRHLPLFAPAEQGDVICRMRTCYEVTLWPITVAAAAFESPDLYDFLENRGAPQVLRIRLTADAVPFEALDIDELRFFLDGEQVHNNRLYELLANNVTSVLVVSEGGDVRELPAQSVQPAGFALDEDVLPYPAASHPAYRLLQEYFVFPEKFQFIDVRNLRGHLSGDTVDILLLLNRAATGRQLVSADTFRLGCTPVINLFNKTTEPIRIDHRQFQYRLVADGRKERYTEIHSIEAVYGSRSAENEKRTYAPFYSYTHAMERTHQNVFWHARRVPARNPELTGTDVMLSFCDLDFDPKQPPEEVVYAKVLCTNRALATQLPPNAILHSDETALHAVCLKPPTAPMTPPLGGQDLWRLVSHLSLNYLSLGGSDDSLKALRAILGLYCFSDSPKVMRQLEGIRSLVHRKVMSRVGGDAWRGFCRGTEVSIVFDESYFVGGSAFLLASVLNHFLALHASINSFTRLVARRSGYEGEEWKRWPPMAGGKIVL